MNKNFDVPSVIVGKVVMNLLELEAHKVTAYLSPQRTVKACRKIFGGKINSRDRRADIQLTIGAPNYAERRFIKACLAYGEPFPVKKLQVKMVSRT